MVRGRGEALPRFSRSPRRFSCPQRRTNKMETTACGSWKSMLDNRAKDDIVNVKTVMDAYAQRRERESTLHKKSKWRVTQPFTMHDRNRLWYMPATWKATFASGSGLRGHRSSGPRWEPLPDIRLPSDTMADRWKTGASPKLRMAHGTTVDRRGLVTFTVKLPPKVMSCLKMSLQPCARPCEGPRNHFIRKQTGP